MRALRRRGVLDEPGLHGLLMRESARWRPRQVDAQDDGWNLLDSQQRGGFAQLFAL
jgi:hypothetical protein